MTTKKSYDKSSLDQFITEAHKILDHHGGPVNDALEEIGDRLARFAAQSDLEGLKAESDSNVIRSESKGLRIVLAEYPEPTEVQSYGTWGVMVVLRGSEQFIRWARKDDGSQKGVAQLIIVLDRELKSGDSAYWPPPPNDIIQRRPVDSPCLELTLSGDPSGEPRHYFDIEAKTHVLGTPL